jgi:hypothetical protein
VTPLTRRLTRLQVALPPPPPPPRIPDLSRFSPEQRTRYLHLRERYQAVGLSGLSDVELEEIAGLVGILAREDGP